MAQLDVQPKQKSPIWIWVVVIVVIIGFIFMLMRGCNKSYQPQALKTIDTDSVATDTAKPANNTAATTQPDWESVDMDLPASTYDEITDTAIVVRGNEKYTIYSLGENVLFEPNDSKLQGGADGRLQMIVNSLNKRFKNAAIGVYGHADSTGNAADNKLIAAKRANAVQDWLVHKGGIAAATISVHSLGETKPIATNGTAKGRQQNGSVEIVAFPQEAAVHP